MLSLKTVAKGGFQRHGYRSKGKRAKQLFILQGLPGVGRERAIRLLDNFGSHQAVINAASDELQTVEGIGRETAERIKWAVSEQIGLHGFSDNFPI